MIIDFKSYFNQMRANKNCSYCSLIVELYLLFRHLIDQHRKLVLVQIS